MNSYDATLNLVEFCGNSQSKVLSWEDLRKMRNRKERTERKRRNRIKQSVSAAWERKAMLKNDS
jgi:hypothetical protein